MKLKKYLSATLLAVAVFTTANSVGAEMTGLHDYAAKKISEPVNEEISSKYTVKSLYKNHILHSIQNGLFTPEPGLIDAKATFTKGELLAHFYHSDYGTSTEYLDEFKANLYEQGIYSEGTDWDSLATREDMFLLVGDYYSMNPASDILDTDLTVLDRFSDLTELSENAEINLAKLVNSGIVTGNNGKLSLDKPATLEHVAKLFASITYL